MWKFTSVGDTKSYLFSPRFFGQTWEVNWHKTYWQEKSIHVYVRFTWHGCPHKEMRPIEVSKPKYFYTRLNKVTTVFQVNLMIEANEPATNHIIPHCFQKPAYQPESLSRKQMISQPIGFWDFLLSFFLIILSCQNVPGIWMFRV